MDISDKLLKQRIRNRIIENLDLFADENCVELLGTDEIINMWYDHMDDNETFVFFSAPVFSSDEIASIKRFHNLLESSYKHIPSTLKSDDLVSNKAWASLVQTAKEEIKVFMVRGAAQ